MAGLDLVELNSGRHVMLVVVASLEVALGSIQVVGAESLERTAVNADGQLVALVANFVRESLTLGHIADGGALLAASAASIDAHGQSTRGVVVQLSNRLAGDGIINVDLTNANLAVVLRNLEVTDETVRLALGIP